ncbi:lipase family protein [Paenibacillus qinlingensis]|uniref:Triacylglycerol lipase n=1 Tax=Paenibacillus qinlingensis TaxID=1837343 RepID=A0ABU1P3X8_9BACL|nr:lipase family protein [Paenibacillus qinlingensis]MDR6554445.1 triacylglycerol lipase [Paenibacillus qinlingensis]
MFSNTMDTRTAIRLSAMCGQSYTQLEQGTEAIILPAAYRIVSPITANAAFGGRELFGFIAESDSQIVIVFRGTSTTSDWISDAIARQTDFPYAKNGGLVHQGFLDIYESARKPILASMSKLSPHKQVYLTGHSLGGSLSTLCAADLATNTKFKNPAVYTFGSPRVGNTTFAKQFNLKTGPHYRVYNRNDMVPFLPPLVYKSPRTGDLYHYIHVKRGVELAFPTGSFAGNHAVSSYYTELAKLDPKYVKLICAKTPGFCPN